MGGRNTIYLGNVGSRRWRWLPIDDEHQWKRTVGVVIVVQYHADLHQIILALHAACGFTDLLNRRKQQCLLVGRGVRRVAGAFGEFNIETRQGSFCSRQVVSAVPSYSGRWTHRMPRYIPSGTENRGVPRLLDTTV